MLYSTTMLWDTVFLSHNTGGDLLAPFLVPTHSTTIVEVIMHMHMFVEPQRVSDRVLGDVQWSVSRELTNLWTQLAHRACSQCFPCCFLTPCYIHCCLDLLPRWPHHPLGHMLRSHCWIREGSKALLQVLLQIRLQMLNDVLIGAEKYPWNKLSAWQLPPCENIIDMSSSHQAATKKLKQSDKQTEHVWW